jgi:hypothetical protein
VTERNGRRSKTLATKAGDIEIGIPKLRRAASFLDLGTPGAGSTRLYAETTP